MTIALSMSEQSDIEIQQELEELLQEEPVELQVYCTCGNSRAQTFCTGCGVALCWNCACFRAEQLEIYCNNCSVKNLRKLKKARARSFLQEPFLYVGIALVATVFAYVSGTGKTTSSKLLHQDSNKAWHEQRAPHLWIQQALRARERMNYLAAKEKRQKKERWAALARLALYRSAEVWKEESVYSELKLAEAIMTAEAGDIPDAYVQLHELENKFVRDSRALAVWQYYTGRYALALDKEKEAVALWSQLLKSNSVKAQDNSLYGQFNTMVDTVLDTYSNDQRERMIEKMTAVTAGTDKPVLYYRRLAAAEVISKKIELDIPIPQDLLLQSQPKAEKGSLVIKRQR